MNQNPEQIARDEIDRQLAACGWIIQDKKHVNLNAGIGIAVKEYQTDVGPADYVLFVDRTPLGVIEAKRAEEGINLKKVEDQSAGYAGAKLKYLDNAPLSFAFESTGKITRFTDYRDPKPRSREVYTFFRPETLREYSRQPQSLRARLQNIPKLPTQNLRECQINAINNLEGSFKANRPRAVIQMATGSGKTFTAITSIYRLLKYADAKRVLFLVDTRNLGEQAEQEFMAFVPNDDNRKFTELYNVQLLRSNYIASDSQVCISTIQRMYSILRGEEKLDDAAEQENPNERWQPKEVPPIEYNKKLPIEFFDFIVIDECHRSIYNLWKQVLDYFDAFLVGLTATPDSRTFGFFDQNIVSEYTHEQAVADGVNVGHDVFIIETEITKNGAVVKCGEYVDRREKMTRQKRWEQMDEDLVYTPNKLDGEVVNPNQIRTIIRSFRDNLRTMFPERQEVPKTLIFAKTDSHADDIIEIVRQEFEEGNAFCKKVTYRSAEDPKTTLSDFRNAYNPRIAVTVDMIATGTDVRPLECLLFMRDVRSRSYFEQMKGRGTRTQSIDDLRRVTPSARHAKDRFVIVDAIGVTKSLKTDSRPLERKQGVPLKDLLGAVTMGATDEDLFTSLAGRLARLDKQLTENERTQFTERTGKTLSTVVKELLNAFDPDTIDSNSSVILSEAKNLSKHDAEQKAQQSLIHQAASTFHGELNEWIDNVRRIHDQVIDTLNPDVVTKHGWNSDTAEQAQATVNDFKAWIESHRDEITALQIFYGQPYRRRELTFKMIKDLFERLKQEKPLLAPERVWHAYAQLEQTTGSFKTELTALVALVRRVTGIDKRLTPYDKTVDENFRNWIFQKNAGQHNRFTPQQMEWLRMIKDYIATSFHIERDDFELSPFNAVGGLGVMWSLFGEETDAIIDELNTALVA